MKRTRRKSLDHEEQEETTKKRKEPRIDFWLVPQFLEKKLELCERLYEFIRGYKDKDGHCLCEYLVRVPSRRTQPDYYQIIEKPIDLMRIQHKLKTGCYTIVSQFVLDIRLLLDNAKDYYRPSSGEYKKAITLEKEFKQSLQLYIESEDAFSPTSPKTVSLKLSSLISSVQSTPTLSKATASSVAKTTPTASKSASSVAKTTPAASKATASSVAKTTPTASKTTASSVAKTTPTASKTTAPSVAKTTPTASKSASTSSITKSSKIKTTRSKAWLDDFRSSDNPIRIYFADIYTYHDLNGEYTAQPFIEMPSRKDYPEYYDVIVEPVDLNTIKRNIDSKTYTNLRSIQDDLLLMIKNAHYFNEPGSAIYKMATTLRKYVINRCLELERKYKTVVMKRSPPPGGSGDGIKNIRSPPSLGGNVPKSKRYSMDATEDSESADELTATESEEEEGGTKERLLLRVKTEKLFGKEQDLLEKILKFKTRPRLKKLLLVLYRVLVNTLSEDKRMIAELFLKRPSAKLYPEYYIVITRPIDFREISRKIKDDQYKCLDEFIEDVELLVDNACTFNEENSQIHSDALMLRKIALSSYDQLQKRWGAPVSLAADESADKLSITNSIKVLYLSLINATDMTGRNLWHTVRDAPPTQENAEHIVSKKCLGMTTISQKMEKGEYSSLNSLFADLCILFESYCEHNVPGSQPYKDAVMLHRISVTKFNDLSKEQKLLHQYPCAQDEVKKLLILIMNRTIAYKDESGCVLSDSLRNVVVTQETSAKEESKSRRVFSLHKISGWVSGGRYTRLDQLQNDVLQILNKAKQNSSLTNIARSLEKGFISIRDEVCDSGSVLWSPALKRAMRDVVQEEEEERIMKEEQVRELEKKKQADNEEMDTTDQLVLEPIIPLDQRKYCDSLTVRGVVYEPGEFLYLPPREPHLPSQVSLIERLWTDEKGNEWFDGCWFPRPHETYHVASRKFYEQEIFKSDFYCSHRLSQVIGKCCVLFVKDYLKYEPEGFNASDVFLCESRYLLKQKGMRKIKSWNVSCKHQPVLIPRRIPCSLVKVPSVFVTMSTGEGSITSSKSDRGSLEPVPEQGSVLEQDSVSEQVQSDAKTEDIQDGVCSEGESDDILEMSFFEDLKEVPATVANPEENHTYFEQYCIDDKVFKLGDYVCVRSDQQHPYIARIDKMWIDNDNDPWFHGPWFVRMEETKHLPTRMFYERELFMSNINDTNPMRSIMRKCIVLGPTEYIKLRPTEVLESDVFICESKYNEADRSIRKHKGLKVFQLSDSVLPNEIYYLTGRLQLWKCHSPNLIPIQAPPTKPPVPLATPTAVQTTPITTQQVTPTAPVVTVPLSSGQLTLTLPQLQALISSQIAKPATPTPPIPLTPPTNMPSIAVNQPTILAYPCTWGTCGEIFEDNVDLCSHIFKSNHIIYENDGYYCYWNGCPRSKEHNGKPFDTLQKITRHIREVHMLRISAQKVPLDQLGINYHRRGTFRKDMAETTPTQSIIQQPNPLIALGQSVVSPLATPIPVSPIIVPSLQSTTPISPNIVPVAPVQSTVTMVTPSSASPTANKQATPPNVFAPPPRNTRQVIHSQIYQDYIRRLRNNEDTISSLEYQPVRTTPLDPPAHPSEWIDETCIPDGMTPVEALYHLRDVLMNDAIDISNVLNTVQ